MALSFSGNTANQGLIFTTLKPWSERHGAGQTVQAIIGDLRGQLSAIPEARIFPVNPPAIQGLGQFGGFQFELQDRKGNSGLDTLVQAMGGILKQANQTPGLQAVFSTYAANTPQLIVEVDRNQAKALNISLDDIFQYVTNGSGFAVCERFYSPESQLSRVRAGR